MVTRQVLLRHREIHRHGRVIGDSPAHRPIRGHPRSGKESPCASPTRLGHRANPMPALPVTSSLKCNDGLLTPGALGAQWRVSTKCGRWDFGIRLRTPREGAGRVAVDRDQISRQSEYGHTKRIPHPVLDGDLARGLASNDPAGTRRPQNWNGSRLPPFSSLWPRCSQAQVRAKQGDPVWAASLAGSVPAFW
jgi:hypothetical protein